STSSVRRTISGPVLRRRWPGPTSIVRPLSEPRGTRQATVSRKKQKRSTDAAPDAADAAPADEILAEGSGSMAVPTTVEELAEAVDELEARAAETHEPAPVVDDDPEPAETLDASEAIDARDVGEPGEVIEPLEASESIEASEPSAEGVEAAENLDGVEGGEAAVLPVSAAIGLDDTTLKHLVEAIVFAAEKPVTLQRLRQLTRIADARRLEQAL